MAVGCTNPTLYSLHVCMTGTMSCVTALVLGCMLFVIVYYTFSSWVPHLDNMSCGRACCPACVVQLSEWGAQA